jgi:hypothetical protein
MGHVLLANVPFSRLGLPRELFPLRTDFPDDGKLEEHARGQDDRVPFPVCGLAVPAAGRRPDMLRIATMR